jgi:alkanesulfonate monooxygenase SsuD/methylene tetrahydromethanopterin reductase-like flavin-dependent oxidoreductase (luciferase family)
VIEMLDVLIRGGLVVGDGYERVLDYVRRRFVFCGTPEEVEAQVRAAMDAGATNFDGAIDAELPEHEERITAWGRLVLPRFEEA